MSPQPSRGLFITGTGTEVGKTYVASLLAQTLYQQGIRVGVYKPVASGCSVGAHGDLIADDARILWEAAGKPGSLEAVCPQKFQAALAPHRAAEAAGQVVDQKRLREGLGFWADQCDVVLIEGAGGLMSPLSQHDYNADLAQEFGYPLVVVAPNRLGVINDVLQTLITATTFQNGLPVAGIVLNHLEGEQDLSAATNRQELSMRCVPPLLAEVSWQGTRLQGNVDWLNICGCPG